MYELGVVAGPVVERAPQRLLVPWVRLIGGFEVSLVRPIVGPRQFSSDNPLGSTLPVRRGGVHPMVILSENSTLASDLTNQLAPRRLRRNPEGQLALDALNQPSAVCLRSS